MDINHYSENKLKIAMIIAFVLFCFFVAWHGDFMRDAFGRKYFNIIFYAELVLVGGVILVFYLFKKLQHQKAQLCVYILTILLSFFIAWFIHPNQKLDRAHEKYYDADLDLKNAILDLQYFPDESKRERFPRVIKYYNTKLTSLSLEMQAAEYNFENTPRDDFWVFIIFGLILIIPAIYKFRDLKQAR